MRTTIEIDDRLMRQAMRSSGARTKRALDDLHAAVAPIRNPDAADEKEQAEAKAARRRLGDCQASR
jgi:Arc/MetJ family transcription regulator